MLNNLRPIKSEESSIEDLKSQSNAPVPNPKMLRVGRGATISSFKILSVSSLSVLLLFGFLRVGGTGSFFTSLEVSSGNTFHADPIDFTVALSTSTEPIDMSAGGQMIVPTMTPTPDSHPIQYRVTSQMMSGDEGLCSALYVVGTFPFPYAGPLVSFTTGTSTETGPWSLTFSLAHAIAPAAPISCSVDLIYDGWDTSVPSGTGFSHEEILPLTFVYNPPAVSDDGSGAAVEDNASSTPTDTGAPAVSDDSATSTDQTVDTTDNNQTASDASTTPEISPPTDATTTPSDITVTPPAGGSTDTSESTASSTTP